MSLITHAHDNDAPAPVARRPTAPPKRLVSRPGIHHATVAVATGDGKRRWSAAGGLTPGTPFFLASVTKRFIVTLVLQARERGELELDAPIGRYLPAGTTAGLHVLGGVDRTSEITVRHLASHTSGLPDYFEHRRRGPTLFQHLAAGRDQSWTFEDVLRMTREQRPHFAPQDLTAARQRARYSDTGFQLLIRVLETVTGRSFADLLSGRILGPLGLTGTWLPGHAPPHAPAPSPLHARRRPVDLTAMIASSNDLYGTTGDLLTFQRALLGGALFDSVDLPAERRNRLRDIPVLRYGLGTMFFTVNRFRRPLTLAGHSGVTGTWLFHCPEYDLHLTGTVDQTTARALPFQIMTRCLRAWRT